MAIRNITPLVMLVLVSFVITDSAEARRRYRYRSYHKERVAKKKEEPKAAPSDSATATAEVQYTKQTSKCYAGTEYAFTFGYLPVDYPHADTSAILDLGRMRFNYHTINLGDHK